MHEQTYTQLLKDMEILKAGTDLPQGAPACLWAGCPGEGASSAVLSFGGACQCAPIASASKCMFQEPPAGPCHNNKGLCQSRYFPKLCSVRLLTPGASPEPVLPAPASSFPEDARSNDGISDRDNNLEGMKCPCCPGFPDGFHQVGTKDWQNITGMPSAYCQRPPRHATSFKMQPLAQKVSSYHGAWTSWDAIAHRHGGWNVVTAFETFQANIPWNFEVSKWRGSAVKLETLIHKECF